MSFAGLNSIQDTDEKYYVIESNGSIALSSKGSTNILYASKIGSDKKKKIKNLDGSPYEIQKDGFEVVAAENVEGKNYLALTKKNGKTKVLEFDSSWTNTDSEWKSNRSKNNFFTAETLFHQQLFFEDEIIEGEQLDTYNSWAPNEPGLPRLWALHNYQQYSDSKKDADIDAYEVFSYFRKPTSAISPKAGGRNLIAIIDSGLNYNHIDLRNQYARKNSEVLDGKDNDRNGLIDDRYGLDFYNNDRYPWDDVGHGTHVASIAGADANGQGILGSNPEARLVIIRNGGKTGVYTSNSIRSVNYAITTGARVINMSWGGPTYSSALYNSLKAAQKRGIIMVASAGNSETNIDYKPSYPASYNLNNIVTVDSTNPADSHSYFTNYGKKSVDVMAPGSMIFSASHTGNSSYNYKQGTSMAAPLVSGVISYYWSHKPNLSPKAVIKNLYKSVDNLGYGNYIKTGGRINMARLFGIRTSNTKSATLESEPETKNIKGWSTSNDEVINHRKNENIFYLKTLDNLTDAKITNNIMIFFNGKKNSWRRSARDLSGLIRADKREFRSIDFVDTLKELNPGFAVISFKDNVREGSRLGTLKALLESDITSHIELDSEMSYF